jgi:hypothetical protein
MPAHVNRFSQFVVTALCVALIPCASYAQTKKSGRMAPAWRGPRFTDRERETISKYLHNPYSPLPPQMRQGGGDVPPGLRKQLLPTAILPPELQPRVVPLPPPLEARLRRLPKPYERAVVGPDVIILNRKTQQISDVMLSVLIPAHTMYN